jgi:hypothetical protein
MPDGTFRLVAALIAMSKTTRQDKRKQSRYGNNGSTWTETDSFGKRYLERCRKKLSFESSRTNACTGYIMYSSKAQAATTFIYQSEIQIG